MFTVWVFSSNTPYNNSSVNNIIDKYDCDASQKWVDLLTTKIDVDSLEETLFLVLDELTEKIDMSYMKLARWSMIFLRALILEDNYDTPLDQSFAEEPKEGT